MKQILQNLRDGQTSVIEVPAPTVAAGRLTIATRRTLISAGTEKMLVEFGQAGLLGKAKAQPEKVKQVLAKMRTDGLLPTLEAVFSKLDEPLPLGYCNAGVVTAVGPGAVGFEVGQRVVSNGPHAELVSVPALLCARIPENVSDDEAAFTVLASIGLQGVRLIEPTLGETVVVYGLGLIGLVTAQLLRASGCQVIGVDINPRRLELARQFGTETIHGGECPDLPAKVRALTQGRGADGVLITASAKGDAIVAHAAQMCRTRGRVVLVGVVGLNLNRADFYRKEISFQVSCSYGPGRYDTAYEEQGHDYPLGYVRWTEQRNFEAILAMLAAGTLSLKPLITHQYELHDAASAYQAIQDDPSSLGVLLTYPEHCDASRTIALPASRPTVAAERLTAAVIGAGNFTRATLMPALSKLPLRIKYVVGRTGGAAVQHVAQKFAAEQATTDLSRALEDPEVNLVLVTTNHDSHASLVRQSLAAGKHVFVEKPLALKLAEIESIKQTVASEAGRQLMVGYNRRFSPHVQKCQQLLKGRAEPLAINFLINAGAIPADHWVHDSSKGGGRIIGEACHFIDLAQALTGSLVRSVSAQRMGSGPAIRDDKMSITLAMQDGSVASISYFANGSKSFPKESVTIFSDNRVLVIDNFRVTVGYDFTGFRRYKTSRQEKGHSQQFAALVNSLSLGGEWLIPFEQLVNSAQASIAAVLAAHTERVIKLDELLEDIKTGE